MQLYLNQSGLDPGEDVCYGALRGLRFAPEAGVLGEAAAINGFTADIATADDIAPGDYARLRDGLGGLWAQYWLTSARRVDRGTVRVAAQSDLLLLDKPVLPAKFYDNAAVSDIVEEIFAALSYGFAGSLYALDQAVGAVRLTGFCPEQTARERLQWVCFAAGAMVKSWFGRGLSIVPVPGPEDAAALIPMEKTFWKPRVVARSPVTAVTVTGYRFSPGTPQPGDKYVTDQGGATYIYTAVEATIQNPAAQGSQFPENVVRCRGVMLLDEQAAARAAARLARYHFAGLEVRLEAIDDGEYLPGDRVTVCGGEGALYTGVITGCDFRFGVQARAALTVAAAERTPSAALVVVARCAGEALDTRRYTLPAGYGYALSNPFIDLDRDGRRRVFRPLSPSVTGTLPAGGDVVYVEYEPALVLSDGALQVLSVDGLNEAREGEVTIQ